MGHRLTLLRGMTESKVPQFIRLSDLADEVGLHPSRIEKYLWRGVISMDGEISHGRGMQPIFLRKRLPALVKAIRANLEQPLAASV